MNPEKRLRAASQLVNLSSIADNQQIISAQDNNFHINDWSALYHDAPDQQRILIDFVRAIVDDEAGCDVASLRHLDEFDRAAVVHGLTIAYTSKDGIENG